jgi:ferredoxin
MKITVDHDACSGHARCHAIAPGLYDIDDEGYSTLGELEVPAGGEQAARDGAAGCPERAITITD